MLDTLRLVSSEDVGHDEASAQSLVKKHKVFFLSLAFLLTFSLCYLHKLMVCYNKVL